MLMDVFIPKHRNRTPTPAVLWIHGGGWEVGDKNGNFGAKFLANEGFVTASLSYRLSGDSPFPAAIEDCKCAIRFLRANAPKYGIDPDRIGVAGSSAGGINESAALSLTRDEDRVNTIEQRQDIEREPAPRGLRSFRRPIRSTPRGLWSRKSEPKEATRSPDNHDLSRRRR